MEEVCIAEYIWIDGTGISMRSKSRTLSKKPNNIDELPIWNFDGSSCYLAEIKNSEIFLKPIKFINDPFRGNPHILVLNELFYYDSEFNEVPTLNSFRTKLKYIFDKAEKDEIDPWFGIEQEFTLFKEFNRFSIQPLGWPDNGYPRPQGPYYCSIGYENNHGRQIVEEHYHKCLAAGIKIFGTNAEVMPGQWEFQIGTCKGIDVCDEIWLARYLLVRVCEKYKIEVSFLPKPLKGDWNGAGCHTNFSTKNTRYNNGYDLILKKLENMEKFHKKSMICYGEQNKERLSGLHETSSINKYSYGTSDRSASFRIPTSTFLNKKGYIEDRRPASNVDPYIVCSILLDTFCYDGANIDYIVNNYIDWQKDKNNRIEKSNIK